ncbi:hypothetical protein QLX08_000024 [Tetragonisca angustula]|uniref:Uncharacterized protein n=1 Tax=Tetragonisca angustula TaxID=166442 RepID=A0AAW1AL84_9HYME
MDNSHFMDALHLENDLKYTKSIHKRRSSVFQSRTIAFDEHEDIQCAEGAKDADDNERIKCVSEISQEKPFNLEKYIINLRNERKEWINTLKQRKIQRKNLASQKLHLENQGQSLDCNILAEFEKTFVRAQPNYQHIYRNYKDLSAMIKKISMLRNLTYKLNQRFILQMEKRLNKVTDKIIETSRS